MVSPAPLPSLSIRTQRQCPNFTTSTLSAASLYDVELTRSRLQERIAGRRAASNKRQTVPA